MDNNKLPQTERDFNAFFTLQRKKTVVFLRANYKLSAESAEDVYQDSCMALFKNIKEGKLVSLKSSLSTYFTQICIYQTLKKIRDEKDWDSLDQKPYEPTKVDELLGEESVFTVQQQRVMEDIIANLPEPCDRILWSYYYDNMSMTDIAQVIDFKNADSVKAKKTQCMKHLKDKFTNQIKEIFYGEEH